ncbi:MAG TPA: histidine kinase [Bacteroidales bacterium]|nr:histidine kinase [Bacteroidales bacterium]
MKTNTLTDSESIISNKFKTMPTVLIHLFIWLVVFTLPLLFRPGFNGPSGHGSGNMPLPIPLPILMNNIFLVIAFYINLLVLMPRFFNTKKWGYFLLFTVLFLVVSLYFHQFSQWLERSLWPDMFQSHRPRRFDRYVLGIHDHNKGFAFRQFSFIYLFIMTWAISMAYYLFVQLQESVRKADQVLASALQSELSFLKAQINPHFLFNTLNNIYVLTLKKSESAPTAVMKLSNLMRKITNDTAVDFVPFEEEEQFIRDYLDLQELRLNEKTKVNYQVSGDYSRCNIAPRILIPYIDNAFKFGVSGHTASEIDINMRFEGNKLHFKITNAIHQVMNEISDSSGVGLENSKRRLDLLYKDKYELSVLHTEQSYQILLTIEL